jgi:predicted deacylase
MFTDLDFEREGRQIGWLNLPYSPHTDAWGVIPVPAAVIKHGRGPTVLLTGGVHGDEYEGPITLGRLIRETDPAQV